MKFFELAKIIGLLDFLTINKKYYKIIGCKYTSPNLCTREGISAPLIIFKS